MLRLRFDRRRQVGVDGDPGTVHSENPPAPGGLVHDADPGPGSYAHLRQPASHSEIGTHTRDEDHAVHLVETLTHTITVAPRS